LRCGFVSRIGLILNLAIDLSPALADQSIAFSFLIDVIHELVIPLCDRGLPVPWDPA
jgi:hypothetical protein